MKAVTLWQPYLAGVICGDGWCSRLTLGLRSADREFTEAFAQAVAHGYGIDTRTRRDERGYWLVRIGNKTGRFNGLIHYEPTDTDEMAVWLRGLFDSEGNATLLRQPKVSANAWWRRVSFYSTSQDTVDRALRYLKALELYCAPQRFMKPTAGHKGTRAVIEIRLRNSRDQFARFAELVGSSIRRKQQTLDAIAATYQSPGHHARAQAKGAAARRARRDAGGRY